MSHITLIRHGQANSHATDEASYDKLSSLGHQQSVWLGAHLKETQQLHARLYTGTLTRHIETAKGMETGLTPTRDVRLNELEFFALSQAMEDEHGIASPTDASNFVHHFPRVLDYWRQDKLEGVPERFSEFQSRIADALKEISDGEGPALVVTSGGVIAMAMRVYLDIATPQMASLGLSIMNSSIHRFHPIGGVWAPSLFNAVPHLESPDRAHARTHV